MKYEPKFEDYLGKKFGKLEVVALLAREVDEETGLLKKVEGKNYAQPIEYLCKCECGNLCVTCRNSLRDNITRSCGCLKVGRPLGRKNSSFKIALPTKGCNMNKPPCSKMVRMCCWDCDDYEGCKLACTNNPAKCGRYKG